MKKKIISLLTTLVIVVGLIGVMPVVSAGAAAKNVINYNISSSAVTKNATDGKLPSAATVYAGNSYYFNIQVSNDLKVKTFKLYVKDAGKSNYTCTFTDTAKNYMRYTSKKYTFSKAGTVSYYWKVTYTSGSTKTTAAKSVTVKNATNVINTNVSSSRVTANATDGKLPSAATVYVGNSYYFNVQTSSDLKVKKFQLYVKDAGQSKYTCAFTDTATNYMRYTSKKYTFKTAGSVSYYWKLTYTNGKTKQTAAKTVKVNSSSSSITVAGYISSSKTGSIKITDSSSAYLNKVQSFLSNTNWKNNATWGSSKQPVTSTWSGKGCCAYAADFCKYVYGENSPNNHIVNTSISNIKNGDVLYFSCTNPVHYIVVLQRNGNQLITAEGNVNSGRVMVSNCKYTINGNTIYRFGQKYSSSARIGRYR